MAKLYRITGWEQNYEKSQNRKAKKHHWVAMPIKHDGIGFRRIAIQDNATDLFAAWCLIVQVAANCHVRGVLAHDDGTPYDSEDLAIKTGFPTHIFETALEFFSNGKIRWLECSQICETTTKIENTGSESQKSGSEKAHSTDSTDNTVQDADASIRGRATVSFFDAMENLRREQSIENAIAAIYAAHESFDGVNRMHIENSLAGQPDKSKWVDAIGGMAAKFAGAEMAYPNRTLQNWLAGKPGTEQQPPKSNKQASKADMFRVWDSKKIFFESQFKIRHADFADQIRIDLADMTEAQFGRMYKKRAVEVREILVAWGY